MNNNKKAKTVIQVLDLIKKEKNTIAALMVKKYALESRVYSLPSINPAQPVSINAVSDHDAIMLKKSEMLTEIEKIDNEIKTREKLINQSRCIFNDSDITYRVLLIDIYLFGTSIQKEAEKYNLNNRTLSNSLYSEIENIVDKNNEWKKLVDIIETLGDDKYTRLIS